MRIAQVSPLWESVPPLHYGGTERVVHYLTEELVRRGHDVVLFASGDSRTSAELHACVPQSLRQSRAEGRSDQDPSIHETIQVDRVMEQLDCFDVLHFHTGHVHLPIATRLSVPFLNTVHGPLCAPDQALLYGRFSRAPLVSISEAQRRPLPSANWLATVPHGLPPDLYRLEPAPDPYLAFVGRVSPQKRLDRAILIATAAGLPLKVAAKVDPVDAAYFEHTIQPQLLGNPLVEFLGELDDAGKQELLGHALALLFPIDWPEPFGLVMIEANACGTPVIAWSNGSTPEVIQPGVNGVLVESIEEAVAAVNNIERFDRRAVRADFEARFTVQRQADAYEQLYRHLIQAGRSAAGGNGGSRSGRVRGEPCSAGLGNGAGVGLVPIPEVA